MGMYSRVQGPIAKPSARTKTVGEVLAIAPRNTRVLAKQSKAEPLENELEACERAITNSFREVALAFEKIKRKHLYKLAGYETFEDYCEKRWNRTRQRGYQFAAAGAVLKSLPDSMSNFVDTEGAARALSAVPEEKRVEVLKKVSKTGSVTAKAIRAVATGKVIEAEVMGTTAVKHCPTCTCP